MAVTTQTTTPQKKKSKRRKLAAAVSIRFYDEDWYHAAKALAAKRGKSLSEWLVSLAEKEVQACWETEMRHIPVATRPPRGTR